MIKSLSDLQGREGINKWLLENRRKFSNLIYHFSEDTNNDRVEKFETAKLRALFVMLSDGPTRSVSNTLNAVFALCREKIPQRLS